MNNRLSDEDRADTARMLEGCARIVAGFVLIMWAVLS